MIDRGHVSRLPVVTITIALAAWAISMVPGASIALQFDRDALSGGELWRLVTGHLTHWTSNHLAWDLAAFALLGALIERRSRRLLITTLIASALTISGAVWFIEPDLATYRGLSGVDSALFVAATACIIRESITRRTWLSAVAPCIAALAFTAKLIVEATSATPLFVAADASFVPVPLAHVIGATTGAVTAAFGWGWLPLRSLAFIGTMQLVPNAAHAGDGVVLLHGLCRSPASMSKIESTLVAAGYVVENVGYDSRAHSIHDLSDQTIGAALAGPRLRECATIHFVTHSLGGILVRDYFSRHPTDRLGRVVMLAPPNRGSEVVDRIGGWFLFRKINGPAGSELGTDVESTPNQLGPVGFECGVIAGDRSINWINSAMLPGHDDGKVSVDRSGVDGMSDHMVIHTTHPYIMKNPTAIESTLRFLQTGRFRPMTGEQAVRPTSGSQPITPHQTSRHES